MLLISADMRLSQPLSTPQPTLGPTWSTFLIGESMATPVMQDGQGVAPELAPQAPLGFQALQAALWLHPTHLLSR